MFNEKSSEWSKKQKKSLPVRQSKKYQEAREEARALLKKHSELTQGDFWILMHDAGEEMQYDGLIISHNACLKLNDAQPNDRRFRPECVQLDKEGYEDSLVFTYICPEQGIFEVGEINPKNYSVAYPYAMALKRCFDRVVLKLTKISYHGLISDSEADELNTPEPISEELLAECEALDLDLANLAAYLKKTVEQLTPAEVVSAVKRKRAHLQRQQEGSR